MITSLTNLSNFTQGGVWDEQRFGGTFYPPFRDYATIVIGLYGAASGTSLANLLTVENSYAGMMSEYAAGTVFDTTYKNLPAKNVVNTTLGYELYQGMNGKSCY